MRHPFTSIDFFVGSDLFREALRKPRSFWSRSPDWSVIESNRGYRVTKKATQTTPFQIQIKFPDTGYRSFKAIDHPSDVKRREMEIEIMNGDQLAGLRILYFFQDTFYPDIAHLRLVEEKDLFQPDFILTCNYFEWRDDQKRWLLRRL